jgi:hypothetical protein
MTTDDLVLDTLQCPISGRIMRDPVLMSDEVTYDAASLGLHAMDPGALEEWLQTHTSPFTGLPWIVPPIPNRAIRDLAEDTPHDDKEPPDALPSRLRVSLMTLVDHRLGIDHALDFILALKMFTDAHPDAPDAWPLDQDKPLCRRLVWHACARLRAMVYAEFTNAVLDPTETPDTIRRLAAQHFIAAMVHAPYHSKTGQLIYALESAFPNEGIDVTRISAEWSSFWGDPPFAATVRVVKGWG